MDSRRGEVFILAGENPEGFFLDPVELQILENLQNPLNLQGLNDRLKAAGWEEFGLEEVPNLLKELENLGVVKSFDEESFSPVQDTPPAAAAENSSLCFFAWPTKNRPELLRRSMDAWNRIFPPGEGAPAFIVADDSDAGREAVLREVRRFSSGAPREVYYLDGDVKDRFIDSLPEALKPPARYALGRDGPPKESLQTYGANRNAVLLFTAGFTVAMADDDMLPHWRKPPEARPGVELFSGLDPSTVVPLKDMRSAEGYGTSADPAEYLEVLKYPGKSVRTICAETGTVDLSRCSYEFLQDIISGHATAAALGHYYWGDSGMGAPYYLLANRDQLQADLSNPGAYDDLVRSKIIFRGAAGLTIGGRAFMGGHIIIDNRSALVPFSPVGRNDDTLWAATLRSIHPEKHLLHSNLSILHAPEMVREGSRDTAARWKPGLNDSLHLLVTYLDKNIPHCSDGFRRIGQGLVDLAGSTDRVRNSLSAELTALAILGRKSMLRRNLDLFQGQPEEWAEDVEKAIVRLDECLETEAFFIPEVFRNNAEDFWNYCRNFGGLLIIWQELFEEACKTTPGILTSILVS